MNKQQRKNRQRREYRNVVTEVSASPEKPRQPLKGFEEFYSISINGNLWSNRSSRFIKPTLGLDGKTLYLKFQISGKSHQLPLWKAVADSWLTIEGRALVMASIPEAMVSGPVIVWDDAIILDIMSRFGLPAELTRSLIAAKFRELRTKNPNTTLL